MNNILMRITLVFLVLVCLSSLTTNYAQPLEEAVNGRLAFAVGIGNDIDIFTINPDGSDLHQLTDNSTFDGNPDWSPDGQQIVFTSTRNGNGLELFLMDSDGANQTPLVQGLSATSGTWSPDGQQIVFTAQGTNSGRDVYIINEDGTGLTNLTGGASYVHAYPVWSSDGSSIYVLANLMDTTFGPAVGPPLTLYQLPLDGSDMVELFDVGSSVTSLRLNTDGTLFLYDFGLNFHLVATRSIDAPSETLLISDYEQDPTYPIWSPDGNLLAYVKYDIETGANAIAIMDLVDQTTEMIYFYNSPNHIRGLAWQPIFISCNNPNPITDTTTLISEITAGNSFGAPYTICLENSTYTLNAVNNSSTGDNGLPVITGDITILGNGATITRDVAAADFRLFNVVASGSLRLENMTLSNGDVGNWLAIYSQGDVQLNNVTCEGFLMCHFSENTLMDIALIFFQLLSPALA